MAAEIRFWVFMIVVSIAFLASLGILGLGQEAVKQVVEREREETIRLAIEKGQTLDPVLVDRLRGRRRDEWKWLLVGGIVIIAAGIGHSLGRGTGVTAIVVGLGCLAAWALMSAGR